MGDAEGPCCCSWAFQGDQGHWCLGHLPLWPGKQHLEGKQPRSARMCSEGSRKFTIAAGLLLIHWQHGMQCIVGKRQGAMSSGR